MTPTSSSTRGSARGPAATSAAFEPLCDHDVHYEDPLTPEPIEGARGDRRARASGCGPRSPTRACRAPASARSPGPTSPRPVKVLATHRREVAGLAATNRFVIVHAVLYCELREERLLRIRAFFDLYGAAVQLGVLPRPGTMGEKAPADAARLRPAEAYTAACRATSSPARS